MFDVIVALVFCGIGYLFNLVNVPVAPVFLGFILQPLIEKNLVLANTIAEAKGVGLLPFIFSSKLCLIIIAIGIVLLVLNVMAIKNQKKTEAGLK